MNSAEQFESLHDGRVQRVRVESIELDLSQPEHMIVIFLRDLDHPQCLFGWRAEAVEPSEPGQDHPGMDPEFWTTVIQANLEEDILAIGYGLPKDCSSDGINWF